MRRIARDRWIKLPPGSTHVRITKAGVVESGVPAKRAKNEKEEPAPQDQLRVRQEAEEERDRLDGADRVETPGEAPQRRASKASPPRSHGENPQNSS